MKTINYLKNLKLLSFVLLTFGITTSLNAQVIKAFSQRTAAATPSTLIYNIQGDYTMVGNTNLTLQTYGDFTNNSNNFMEYVDIDGDPSTFNSSSATLEFSTENGAIPECSNILFAGLYWTGRSSNTSSSPEEFSVTHGGVTKDLHKRKAKLKGPGQASYTEFEANPGNIYYPDGQYGNMYSAFVEVTDYVEANGVGEYFVGDLALIEGNGGATGYYGGWGLIVVYENSKMNWRDVTIFDGHAYVQGNATVNFELPVSGFETAQAGPINMKLGLMAGEGDVGISGDYFRVRNWQDNAWITLDHSGNSTTNFYNGSVNTGGNPRNPTLQNNTGLDIAMFDVPNPGNTVVTNGQTSTRFQYGSTQDTYIIFCIAMAVDAYIPDVESLVNTESINGVPVGAGPVTVQPGEDIEYKVEIKNLGTEAIDNAIFSVPIPYNTSFVPASIGTTVNFTPLPTPNNAYFDPLMGPTGSVVWDFGTLPLTPANLDSILAELTFHLEVTTDCYILTNPDCPQQVVLTGGTTAGVGATSGSVFDLPFIQGYETSGVCLGEPITDPLTLDIDAAQYITDNCGSEPTTRDYLFCNYEDAFIPYDSIAAGFPAGIGFYNENNITPTTIEYDENNPFPANAGSNTYFAIPDGVDFCYYTFTITVQDPILTSAVETSQVSCAGGNDGAIDLTILGGIPPYTYDWTGPAAYTADTQDINSLFAGQYFVTISDSLGCTAPDSAIVTTILDVTDPIITCPANNSTTTDGGVCTYTHSGAAWDATATDECGLASITYSMVGATTGTGTTSINGVVFGLGTTTITWTSTDLLGNTDVCVSTVTVTDEEDPAISNCGSLSNQNEVTDNGVCTYTHSGTAWDATATDNCTVSTTEYVLSGATTGTGTTLNNVAFNLGTTTVTWTTTDLSANTSTCIFTVTVTDDQDPTFIACGAGNQTVTSDAGVCYYTHSGTAWNATADDNCTVSTIEYDLSGATTGSGTSLDNVQFNLGVTTVTWTVTDASNNTETCSYTITVTDTEDPVITSCGVVTSTTEVTDFGVCRYTNTGIGWDATATDNCTVSTIEYNLTGATTGTGTTLNGITFNLGTTTVTWTATDGSGNTDVCTFDVIVTDNQDPVISSCGGSGTESVVADFGVCYHTNSGTGWNAIANDNCGVASIIYNLSGATTGTGTTLNNVQFNLGTTTVTWTVTDDNGNISTCNFDVEVTDNQDPIISNCVALTDQNEVTDNNVCTYTHSGTGWDAIGSENCTTTSLTYNLTGATSGTGTTLNGQVFQLGTTTVTWTIVDNSGNSTTCVFTVTVTDDQDPTFIACGAGNQTVTSDGGNCYYTHSGTAWNATADDNCTVSTIEYALSGATIGSGTSLDNVQFNLGVTTVTWTVTDASNNTETCSYTVTVTDTEDPAITSCGVMTSTTEVSDFGVCTYTNTGIGWDATATDNCTVSTIEYNLSGATTGTGSTLNGVTFNLGTTTVTWTATDGSGNTDVCTFDVIVTDDQDPVISSCGGIGTENVVVDLSQCTYTHSGTGWDAVSDDNCGVASSTFNLTGATTGTGTTLDNVAFNLGTTTVTWTVLDNAGNSSTCTFDVEVTDDQNPAVSNCASLTDQNEVVDATVCTYTHSGTAWDAIGSENCTIASLTYTLSGASTGTGTSLDGQVFQLGTTNVVWTIVDNSGNSSTCSFDVVVTDDQDPTFIACGAGNQTVISDAGVCYYTHSGTAWNATADDNCTVSTIEYVLTGATSGNGTSLNNVQFNLGTTTVTWTVTDASGNTETCSYTVDVSDTELPQISSCGPSGDQTVNADLGTCTYTYSGTGWNATATDNCTVSTIIYNLTGATTGSGTSLNGQVFNLGSTLVTWTVTDGGGNTSTCSFTVDVLDDQLPAITSCGAVGTQNVNTDLGVCTYTQMTTAWDATATDNCTVSSILYTLSGATTGSGSSLNGVTFAQGTTTVLWTVTDGSGNEVTCTFDVNVTDNEVPSIIGCLTDINVNNDNGACGATVTWTPPTFTDNCGATMTSTHNSGDFFPIGTTTVTYTVTDNSENITICIFDVIVTDSELPQLTCQTDHVSCDSLVTFVIPTATDNCGVISVTQTTGLPSGSIFPVGTTVVTFEALDVNGNTNTCSFNVVINPTPVLATVATDVTCFASGDGSIDLTVTNGTAPYSFVWSNGATTEDISGLSSGFFNVIVTDVNGCSATTDQEVTEPTALVFNKEVTQVSCNGGNDGAIDIEVSGGTLPFTYSWDNGATSEDVSTLIAGSYTVTVTDDNGCTIVNNTVIIEPTAIDLQSSITNATCNAPNGSIQVQVTGGTSPYDYLWSNGATTANLTNVIAGTYTLTVTDDNGCIEVYTDSVGTTSNLSAELHLTDATCYGDENGSALAIVNSGNAPYSYSWSNGDTTTFNEQLTAGSYSVTISDVFGCETTLDFDIYQPDSLYVELYSPEVVTGYNISPYDNDNGSITSYVYGGTPEYEYAWSNGDTTANIYNLEYNSNGYTVTVTDANRCSATATIMLEQPEPIKIPEGVSPNGDGENDFFFVRGLDGYPDNDITIYNRWGNIVYQQNGYQNDWAGENNKGEALPDGTYFVILNAYADDNTITLTGYIDLRRKR